MPAATATWERCWSQLVPTLKVGNVALVKAGGGAFVVSCRRGAAVPVGTVGAVGSVGSAGLVGRKVGAAGKSPVRAGTSPVISSTDIPPGKGFSGSGVGSGAFGFAGGAGAGAAVAGAWALASGASVGPIGGKGAITIDAPAKSVGGSVGAGAVSVGGKKP